MGKEWKPFVCILGGCVVIIFYFEKVYDWISVKFKDDFVSKYVANQLSWIHIVMPILFIIGAFLLIFGVQKEKQMLMLPFIVVGIIYVILDIYFLSDYSSGQRLFETIIDIVVTVIAIVVCLEMGGLESQSLGES